jgi:hypothetical protein
MGDRGTKNKGTAKRNQARLAVKPSPDGKMLYPLQPIDIVRRLNSFDPIARMGKQRVGEELNNLATQGAIRKFGSAKNRLKIFVYLRPKTRSGKMVTSTEYHFLATQTKQRDLMESVVQDVTKACMQRLYRGARRLQEQLQDGGTGEKVTPTEYLPVFNEARLEIEKVTRTAYQKAGLVLCTADAYKEVSTSPVFKESAPEAGGRIEVYRGPDEPARPPQTAEAPPREAEPDELSIGLEQRGYGYLLADEDAMKGLRKDLGGMPPMAYWPILDERIRRANSSRESIGLPILRDKARQARKTWERQKRQEATKPEQDPAIVADPQYCVDCGQYRPGHDAQGNPTVCPCQNQASAARSGV